VGPIAKGRIFELEQIRRAAELDVGVKSASDIRITPFNDESSEAADDIGTILKKQG